MVRRAPSGVNGYVLAGGKSSRMGQDKALLKLSGKPLVLHAVKKLQQVCADVYVLANRPELEGYAPLVRDLHEGCGPLGGIEAALSHLDKAWNLFMAVDMPFLPVEFLNTWVRWVMEQKNARVALFSVDGRPQPALCLLHKDIAASVNKAVQRGEYKLFPVLVEAAKELAGQLGSDVEEVLLNSPWNVDGVVFDARWAPTEAQRQTAHLWFANLNTPEEFGEAENSIGLLEMD